MRRTSDPDTPNGLTDFVIIETINWMAGRGLNGLGLNFAVMRTVVAGENDSGRRAPSQGARVMTTIEPGHQDEDAP